MQCEPEEATDALSGLADDVPLLPPPTTSAGSPGARFWGQVRGSLGRLRVLQGKSAAEGETSQIAGKALYQARFPHHLTAGRDLHGKEAVPGSSPGEGLNTCKTALFDNCRVPIKERLAGRLEEWPRNSLQIVLL